MQNIFTTKTLVAGLFGALVVAPAIYYGNVGGFKAEADFQRSCVEQGGYTPADTPDVCEPNPVVEFSKKAGDIDYRWPTYRHFEADCKAQGGTAIMFEDGSARCSSTYNQGDDIRRGA